MNFFSPEDFTSCAFYEITRDKIVANPSLLANVCNLILAERGVRVLAHQGPSTKGAESSIWIAKPWHDADSTHTALLIAIEPIKRDQTTQDAEELVKSLADLNRLVKKHFNIDLSEKLSALLGGEP